MGKCLFEFYCHVSVPFFSHLQVKINSMKETTSELPVTTKNSDPLHISDMHAGSEAYHIDMDSSYRTSPMKII